MPVAYASLYSDVPGEVISAAVAIGIPKDANRAGLIMEYSARAEENIVVEQVKKMVEKGMELRNRDIKEIKAISATYKVVAIGARIRRRSPVGLARIRRPEPYDRL